MKKTLVGILFFLIFVIGVVGQTEPQDSDAAGATAATQSASANGGSAAQPGDGDEAAEIEKIVFTHRRKLPDSPKPNRGRLQEDNACPDGEGNPCALLGGRVYFRDSWHLTEHQGSWWQAYKTPGMMLSTTMLFASTVVDIEGTQHCLAAGACRELNPVMGNTRAQQYGVAIPMDAFATWVAVREKQRGRGVLPFFVLWSLSSVHLYYGVNGLMPQSRR
jgi:hypothetical protein